MNGWRCHNFHLGESKANCTNQGQENHPAICFPTIPGPAPLPGCSGSSQVHGTSHPQRSQRARPSPSKTLQNGYLLDPIPVFITQTYYPNLPTGNMNSINFRAFHARFLISSLFLSYSFQLRGKAVLFLPEVQPLSLVLSPPPHLLPLKILLCYPVSLTFHLSFPYFLLLGSKIILKDILTSISSKKKKKKRT